MMHDAIRRDALCLELRSSALGISDLGLLRHQHHERFEIKLLPVHWVMIVDQRLNNDVASRYRLRWNGSELS